VLKHAYEVLTELFAVENGRVDVEKILEEALLRSLGHITRQKQVSKHLAQAITAHTHTQQPLYKSFVQYLSDIFVKSHPARQLGKSRDHMCNKKVLQSFSALVYCDQV